MKKTLIALALAATAVSGSVMAWTPNGLGGTMEFGGTLTPKDVVNPWEVQVGPNIDALNGSLKPNEKVVNIILSKAVPLLGIRVADAGKRFTGAPGIAPQIDYKNAVDLDGFAAGDTTLTLKVVKASDAAVELGTLTAKLSAAGIVTNENSSTKAVIIAPVAGNAFFGGLPKTAAAAVTSEHASWIMLGELSASYISQYTGGGHVTDTGPTFTKFADPLVTYSSAYGAGLKTGSTVTINLTSPATADMAWKASFPITVSYQ
ncbi:fimbrial protein [Salmonella enterica subsp. enterica serovar Havana]|nr:fimbrial protein [Salmonella enterica]EBX0470818.1 fimbrial protein [Salmonella enterica subsp. enterica serovar Havana]EBX8404732.1 fimbrial protein [Salmonella enterica subsp. enterica serovar Oranienburg]EAW1071576.1 fimbrial protein [Salmonella enterica]EAY1111206.1 fimbrial protein [Salmonella enterica]